MRPSHTSLIKSRRIQEDDVRQLFLDARTHNAWLDHPVPDSVLREIYDLVKFGPTSMNTQPMRVLFLRTAAAKELGPEAIRLAVIAHIRHVHTNYDALLTRYADRDMAREQIRDKVSAILDDLQRPSRGERAKG